jgi:hypothetical protein
MTSPLDPDYADPRAVWTRSEFLALLEEEAFTAEFNDRQDAIYLTRVLSQLNRQRTPQNLLQWVHLDGRVFLTPHSKTFNAVLMEIEAIEAIKGRLYGLLRSLRP